jgi:hypothetical protein
MYIDSATVVCEPHSTHRVVGEVIMPVVHQ